jgi:predicted ATP-dependent endonuclease of OLD family
MKLVAMWVEDFMKIKDATFNFGSKLVFRFEFNKEKRELFVGTEPTKDYFDLFADTNIRNITGVIGTNGSGKTSLIKLLNLLHAKKPLENRVVMIYEESNGSKYRVFDYKAEDIYYDNKNAIKIIFPKEDKSPFVVLENDHVTIHKNKIPFEAVDLIFYSNLYSDQNDNDIHLNSKLNRSVNYQTIRSLSANKLREYLRIHNQRKEKRTFVIPDNFNPLSLYHKDKLRRLITFLAEVDTGLALFFQNDIPFPETITVWPNESIYENVSRVAEKSLADFNKIADFYSFCVNNNYAEEDASKQFKNSIIYNLFFFSFYNDFFRMSDKNAQLDELSTFINHQPLDNGIYERIKSFMLSVKSSRKNSEINKVVNIISQLDALIKNVNVKHSTGLLAKGSFELEINKSLWRLLGRLISVTDHYDEHVLTINLNPFSAGQGAILGQFSEFFEALKHLANPNVIVTIDEGELYLHPEWQRKYINSLYKFFNYFGNKREINFQLIVTSHSPFLVSDLPRHNVVYMARDEHGMTTVLPSANQKATLGGNIFELFQSGFYMKEFIGEFAILKIEEAIKFLNGHASSFQTLEEVDDFIKLIGEKLIRNELQRIVDIKKTPDFDKNYEIVKDDDVDIEDHKENDKNKKRRK